MSCRIIVADDHPLFREGMLRTIERLLPEAVIEQAGNLNEVLTLARSGDEVDTLILDLRFPGLNSMQAIAELRNEFRRTSIIVVSMVDDPETIAQVMSNGADGFIGKNIDPQEITESIVAIRQGEVVVKYKSEGSIFNESAVNALSPLTTRQKQVLVWWRQEKPTRKSPRNWVSRPSPCVYTFPVFSRFWAFPPDPPLRLNFPAWLSGNSISLHYSVLSGSALG